MSGYEPPRRMSGDHRPAGQDKLSPADVLRAAGLSEDTLSFLPGVHRPVGQVDLVRDNAGHATLSVRIRPELDPDAVAELGRRMAEVSARFQEMRTALSAAVQAVSRASAAFRTAFPEGLSDEVSWTPDGQAGPEDAGEESPGDDGGTSRPA